jgi:hypothetical protein
MSLRFIFAFEKTQFFRGLENGNAAEGIPRRNIRGGRDPLAGGTRTEMQHYTAHVTWPRRLAAPVTARRDGYRVRSDDLREGIVSAGRRVVSCKKPVLLNFKQE